MYSKTPLRTADPELWRAIEQENRRQEQHIELIASENYASPRVMEAQASSMMNKYAEGYPGKRYYAGCEFVDIAEQLAIDRAKELFKAGYANVQPHSGAQANQAVYFATLNPGDTILGMGLESGGHLTHGMRINISGRYYEAVAYGLDAKTEAIDYAEGLVRTGVQSAPVHPETAAFIRRLMTDRGLPVPDANRTLDSICIVVICKGDLLPGLK